MNASFLLCQCGGNARRLISCVVANLKKCFCEILLPIINLVVIRRLSKRLNGRALTEMTVMTIENYLETLNMF